MTVNTAFDDEKQHELTELGKQFVHYTMNEIVPRISAAAHAGGAAEAPVADSGPIDGSDAADPGKP